MKFMMLKKPSRYFLGEENTSWRKKYFFYFLARIFFAREIQHLNCSMQDVALVDFTCNRSPVFGGESTFFPPLFSPLVQ